MNVRALVGWWRERRAAVWAARQVRGLDLRFYPEPRPYRAAVIHAALRRGGGRADG